MHPKRYFLLICLIAVSAHLVFAESDIPGWGKAKWGMPFSEVTKLYGLKDWEPGGQYTRKQIEKKDQNYGP